MAFSKGKRIEDETSKRILDHAVNIGFREGAEALTVTRLCRELNCDRRVIYNRFRDVNEINLLVACRCNEELVAKAKSAMNPQASFYDNFKVFIQTIFQYTYEKNSHFQYYTTLYRMTEEGAWNGVVKALERLINEGKAAKEVRLDMDSAKAARNIWLISTGIGGMLAANTNYQYQDGFATMMYGVEAISAYMKPQQ